jgi:hypothetical protein
LYLMRSEYVFSSSENMYLYGFLIPYPLPLNYQFMRLVIYHWKLGYTLWMKEYSIMI